MRRSRVLARFRSGKAARLVQMGYFLPPFISYAAAAGYEGIWLDLEHHNMDNREVQAILAFCHHYDLDCLVRPPTREKTQLYRYLEDGATGLMIQHISSAAEARELVSKTKFPPVGDRGIEGLGFETNFSLDIKESTLELVEHANRETFLILQIETPDGLAQVDEIAAVPGVDGLFMGPFDLSMRMAYQPEGQKVGVDEAMQRVAAASRAAGKPWGSYTVHFDNIRLQYERGAQILIWGADQMLLKAGLSRCGEELSDLLGE